MPTAIVVEDFTTIVSGASTVTVSIQPNGPQSGSCVAAQIISVIPSFMSGVASASGLFLAVFNAVSGNIVPVSGSLGPAATPVWQWSASSQSGTAFQPPYFLPTIPVTCQSGIIALGAAGINMAVIWTPA
jgi:hypothetical protein